MHKFKSFLREQKAGTLAPRVGPAAKRHWKRGEAKPGSEHELTKDRPEHGLKAGPVTVHGRGAKITNKGHEMRVVVSQGGDHHEIAASDLRKNHSKTENKGHDFESKFAERLKAHGLMPHDHKVAGSSGGTDFTVHNRRKNMIHPGAAHEHVSGDHLRGEAKQDADAAFGQITVTHHHEKGWHITDKAKEHRPRYAHEVEKAGIINHLNHHHPDPEKMERTESGRTKGIVIHHHDLKPADAYLQDHHVDLVHVGSHGTYAVGKDKTGHGFPHLEGKGKWLIRQKKHETEHDRKKLTVQFSPHGKGGLKASHINLDNDDHLEKFKKTMGV